jgi:hypothetical protein
LQEDFPAWASTLTPFSIELCSRPFFAQHELPLTTFTLWIERGLHFRKLIHAYAFRESKARMQTAFPSRSKHANSAHGKGCFRETKHFFPSVSIHLFQRLHPHGLFFIHLNPHETTPKLSTTKKQKPKKEEKNNRKTTKDPKIPLLGT